MDIEREGRDATRTRWWVYGRWFAINILAFAVLYPLVNWWTGLRGTNTGFYLTAELSIPFVPEWIWVYLSINLVFLVPPVVLTAPQMSLLGRRMLAATLAGCAIFAVLPARLGFPRMLPEDPIYRLIFSTLFEADGPHNLVPSLHVAYASLCAYSFARASARSIVRAAWWLWLPLIMASTVLVHQHHLLDVVSGACLAGGIGRLVPARPSQSR